MPSVGLVVNGRLSSTRCPRKLIRPFSGTTLFDISLTKLSTLSSHVNTYVGVADQELINISSNYPNVKLLRRSQLAIQPGYGDHREIFAHYKLIDADYIMWINPCHPLLSIESILKAVDIVQKSQFNSYTSVVPTTDWIFASDGLPITNKKPNMISTAHCDSYMKVAHAFHIFRKDLFLRTFQHWTLTPNDPSLIQIPDSENFDVNTELEFTIAELAYRHFA